MSISCSDVCEYVDGMLRTAGFEMSDDEDHMGMMEALRSAYIISEDLAAAIKGVVLAWDKGNLAEAVNEMRRLFEEELYPIKEDDDAANIIPEVCQDCHEEIAPGDGVLIDCGWFHAEPQTENVESCYYNHKQNCSLCGVE